jgi:hypothetical protein
LDINLILSFEAEEPPQSVFEEQGSWRLKTRDIWGTVHEAEIMDLIKYKPQVHEADLTICLHRKLNEPR